MIDERVRGRVVVVTGGAGFVGSHLVRALERFNPAAIRILGRSAAPSGSRAGYIRGEIDDPSAVGAALRDAHLVFHLAAMKSVTECEAHPLEAARVNVEGARVLAECISREADIERVVAVSSTSAVTVSNVYGKTKAQMERIVLAPGQSAARSSAVVRLGNVWGTPGSVVDRWMRSGSTTHIEITEPEMTRFAMSVGEAVRLLLDAAASTAQGVIVSARMPGYRLGDLADAFSRRAGKQTVPIGARPGEDLHEHLLTTEEQLYAEDAGAVFMVGDRRRPTTLRAPTSQTARRLSGTDLDRVLRELEESRVTP